MRTLWALPVSWLVLSAMLAYDAVQLDVALVRYGLILLSIAFLGVAGVAVRSVRNRNSSVAPNHELDIWTSDSEIPMELDAWNWGAFVFAPYWALGHRIWWGVLGALPYLGLLVSVYLGARGNRIAWRTGPWASFHEFVAVQQVWRDWAGSFLVGLLILFFLAPIAVAIAA